MVQNRDAATLLPIIQAHSENGTIVHSDQWAAYRHVASIPQVARHETLNHSVHFVSPTGVHTQHVESYWNRVFVLLYILLIMHCLFTLYTLLGED